MDNKLLKNQRISVIKKVILIAVLSLIIGMIFTNDLDPVNIERGGQEGLYPISNKADIQQQIIINHTRSLHITLLKKTSPEAELWYKEHPEAAVKVELIQNDTSDSQTYSCTDLENTWDLIDVKLNFSKFQNGVAVVKMSAENVPQEYGVSILFTSGTQDLPIESVVYGGETIDGMYCCLQYGFFPVRAFLISSAIVFAIIAIAYLLFLIIRKSVKKYAVIYAYLAVLVIRYVINIGNSLRASELDSWITTPWIINYGDGFVSKALPGTILSLFTDYISKNLLNVIFHIIFILACVVLCIVMKKLIDIAEERKMNCSDHLIDGINLLLLAYAVGPLSLATYFRQWGRFDVILIICFLVSILIFLYTDKPRLTFIITALSVIAILSHQMYIFVLYPTVFCIFLYFIMIRRDRRYVWPFVTNLFIPAGFGFYVQFLGKINMPLEDYLAVLQDRTDTTILSTMVDGEYYLSGSDNVFSFGTLDIHHFNDGLSLALMIVLMIPILYFLWRVWKGAIHNAAGETIKIGGKTISAKIIYTAIAIIPFIAPVFMFLTISDYGRVLTMFAAGETMLIAVLSVIDRNYMEPAFTNTIGYYNEKYGKWYFTGLLVYLVSLGTCTNLLIPEVMQRTTTDINNWMLDLVKIFLKVN